MHLVPVQTMVDEALDFIRAHEPQEGYFVAFSGGKDSIVSLELVRMAGVRHQAFYSATGIDPPEVVQFIRKHYPDVRFLRPGKNFYQLIKEKFPPLRRWRWCCDDLKEVPSLSIPLSHRMVGLRAEESAKRRARGRVDELRKHPGIMTYKPIFGWREWHVWEFIEGEGMAYPALYDEGFDRIGCVVCPFLCHRNTGKLMQHKNRWPGIYKAFEHAVTWWFDNKANRKIEATAQGYIQAWYRGFE